MKHRELGEIYAEGGDISATGLFLKIRSSATIAIGDVLAVELPRAVNESFQPETRLKVVRVTNEGVGLAFL